MPSCANHKFLFYVETGKQSLLKKVFGVLSKSGLKLNDCKEIGKVCLCV